MDKIHTRSFHGDNLQPKSLYANQFNANRTSSIAKSPSRRQGAQQRRPRLSSIGALDVKEDRSSSTIANLITTRNMNLLEKYHDLKHQENSNSIISAMPPSPSSTGAIESAHSPDAAIVQFSSTPSRRASSVSDADSDSDLSLDVHAFMANVHLAVSKATQQQRQQADKSNLLPKSTCSPFVTSSPILSLASADSNSASAPPRLGMIDTQPFSVSAPALQTDQRYTGLEPPLSALSAGPSSALSSSAFSPLLPGSWPRSQVSIIISPEAASMQEQDSSLEQSTEPQPLKSTIIPNRALVRRSLSLGGIPLDMQASLARLSTSEHSSIQPNSPPYDPNPQLTKPPAESQELMNEFDLKLAILHRAIEQGDLASLDLSTLIQWDDEPAPQNLKPRPSISTYSTRQSSTPITLTSSIVYSSAPVTAEDPLSYTASPTTNTSFPRRLNSALSNHKKSSSLSNSINSTTSIKAHSIPSGFPVENETIKRSLHTPLMSDTVDLDDEYENLSLGTEDPIRDSFDDLYGSFDAIHPPLASPYRTRSANTSRTDLAGHFTSHQDLANSHHRSQTPSISGRSRQNTLFINPSGDLEGISDRDRLTRSTHTNLQSVASIGRHDVTDHEKDASTVHAPTSPVRCSYSDAPWEENWSTQAPQPYHSASNHSTPSTINARLKKFGRKLGLNGATSSNSKGSQSTAPHHQRMSRSLSGASQPSKSCPEHQYHTPTLHHRLNQQPRRTPSTLARNYVRDILPGFNAANHSRPNTRTGSITESILNRHWDPSSAHPSQPRPSKEFTASNRGQNPRDDLQFYAEQVESLTMPLPVKDDSPRFSSEAGIELRNSLSSGSAVTDNQSLNRTDSIWGDHGAQSETEVLCLQSSTNSNTRQPSEKAADAIRLDQILKQHQASEKQYMHKLAQNVARRTRYSSDADLK